VLVEIFQKLPHPLDYYLPALPPPTSSEAALKSYEKQDAPQVYPVESKYLFKTPVS